MLKKDENRDLRLVQNLPMVKADFNQFMLLRNQPLFAAEKIGREEYMSIVLIPTMSKDKDEHIKLAYVEDLDDHGCPKTQEHVESDRKMWLCSS